MIVDIINKSNNPNPKYSTEQSAGMDLHAFLTEEIILKPMERILIPTGLYFGIPDGYEVQIRPRSGLALKNGISVLNTPGTIDSDFSGQICVILINLSQEDFVISSGDRIAQMILNKYEKVEFNNVTELSKTERGEGGFGHTGK